MPHSFNTTCEKVRKSHHFSYSLATDVWN